MKLKFTPKILLTFVFMLVSFLAKAQLPYYESFRNSSAKGIIFGGAPSAFLTASPTSNLDKEGEGYLRLTNNDLDQKGFIYGTNNITSQDGLKMEFEYYIYGGTGADGISFFLFDASANPFSIGGFGGSLGYSQFTLTTPVSPGVSKGYLGIGIDEYGNFSNPIEGRQGGIAGPTPPGLRPNSVTLRGKGDGNAQVANNYPFLTSVQTKDVGFPLIQGSNNRFPDNTTTGYRKASIDLKPNPNGGYNITVKITVGGTPMKTYTVIDDFYYSEVAPANLRYGIASSTGNSTNFHEIRNVFIDVFNRKNLVPPLAVDDLVAECSGKQIVFEVTKNDKSLNPLGFIQANSIDLNPDVVGDQKTFLVAGKGTFTANSNGEVSYSPLNSSVSGVVSIRYTVADNYGVTSNIAKITINEPTNTTPANAGADQTLKASTALGSATLTANLPANATGQWSQISGPQASVIVNPNAGTTAVNNLALGTYVFRWTLSAPGQCTSIDDVQIINSASQIPISIGLAKALTNKESLADGSFNLKFLFTITNFSAVTLENLSLKDDLEQTFAGASYTVVSLNSVSPTNFTVNNAYNGRALTEMLVGNNQLLSQQTAKVEMVVNVKLTTATLNFINTAVIEATSITDGAKATDQSTDGIKPDPLVPADVNPAVPTPINLSLTTLYIPKGFSPNGDGIHDNFVIKHDPSLPLELEIYNRWGNIVYRSTTYDNKWDGKCTEGIYIGQDLPPGTYYYIVNYNATKNVGFLTLNR
ncbi:MAG: gliding motility-associated C-terminal domain-containing protein [Candidatus Dojkabacteria bacterium]